jgi:SAM-dependent methyltransferase
MPELPPFLLPDGRPDWEALFQIYEFAQYRAFADELTRNEVDFIVMALGLPEDAAVLDVACGGGRHALELAQRGYSTEGVDSSATLVAYATRCAYEAATRARFVQGDMRALNYQQQFDAALVMNSSLGFFEDAVNRATLGRVAQSLVDGGKLLLQCLNPYQIERYLQSFRNGWHQIVYGYPELSAMLEEAGLRPIAVFGDAVTPAVPFEEQSLWQVVVATKVDE